MRLKLLLFALIAFQLKANAQVITADRRTDWSLAGYRDTIPAFLNTLNITAYGGLGNGSTANDAALQSAITALNGRSGTIYFPTGNFLFHESIILPDSIILQGNSADSTTLSFNLNGTGDLISISGSLLTDSASFTADATKDSAFIEVSNPGLFNAGDYIRISENDTALLFSNWAYGTLGQIAQINNIVLNRLNLNSPLRKNYSLSDSCIVQKITPRNNVGLQCFKILRLDQSAGQTTNVAFTYAVKCWLKGIESDTCNFAHVAISYSSNVEISGCYIHDAFAFGGDGQGYGIALQYASGECLVENNIFNHLRHSMLLQAGANGNVFGYNTSTNPYWVSAGLPANSAGDMVLHGNYPYLNLFEGNTGQNIVIDNSHGINGPYNTYFRNRADLYGIFMNTGPASDSQNIVGNEVTNSGFLMGLYVIEGNGEFTFGNNIRGSIMPAGTDTLNDTSYYKKTKPVFFAASAAWPGIGIPNIISSGTIPAQERQLYGGDFTDCGTNEPLDYPTQYFADSARYCSDSSYNFNGRILNVAGTYSDTLLAQAGEDSVVTILHLSGLIADTTYFTDSTCAGNAYNFQGQVLDTAGTYTAHLSGSNVCDSLIILQLTVKTIDTLVTLSGPTLTAAEANAVYQWLDCNADTAISGATGQSFTATQSGLYKVRIMKRNCSEISSCQNVITNGVKETDEIAFSIHPNPARYTCTLYMNAKAKLSGAVYDVTGKMIMRLFSNENIHQYTFNIQALPAGIFFIKVSDDNGYVEVKKLVVE